ncbi:MAG: hypothetical protein ACRDZO_28595 [Egibacteraceae bacterium]
MRGVRDRLVFVVLGTGVVAAVALHVMAGLRYPVPWPDEAHFLAPARSFATHLTLVTPEINAPAGIFWMPDGYAVTLGAAYGVLPDTVEAARLVSLALTVGFAGVMYLVGVWLGGPRVAVACAVAVWLVAPRVVLMANIARMEPLVLALVGGALLAVTARRWLTALAVVSLTVLVHPGGLVLTAALAAAAALSRADLRPKGRAELALVGLVTLAWTAQAVWLLTHVDLVQDHLAFQLARKGMRSQLPNGTEVVVGLAAAAGICGSLAAYRRLDRQRAAVLCSLFALVGALAAIRVTGNEMWYGAIGYETPALLLLLAALSFGPRIHVSRPASALIALTPVILVAGLTLTGSAYDMAISPGSPGDRGFLGEVEERLRDFDARQGGPVLVALDRSSGMSPFLLAHTWEHLSFVDPTPVTPLWARPDYVLFSLGPPEPGRRRIEARLPQGPPTLRVAQPGSTAEVLLFPGDRVTLPVS